MRCQLIMRSYLIVSLLPNSRCVNIEDLFQSHYCVWGRTKVGIEEESMCGYFSSSTVTGLLVWETRMSRRQRLIACFFLLSANSGAFITLV